MLTILFDGIAYGMLLFVLAVRAGRDARADELHQPRARCLCHARAATSPCSLMQKLGSCRSWPACRSRSSSSAAGRRWCWSARSTGRCIAASRTWTRCCFPSGSAFMAVAAVDYFDRVVAAEPAAARVVCADAANSATVRSCVGIGHLPHLHHRRCAPCSRVVLQAHPGSKTRFGSRLRAAVDDPRVAAGPGHQRQHRVRCMTFAVGSRPGRAGRRAGRGNPRASIRPSRSST